MLVEPRPEFIILDLRFWILDCRTLDNLDNSRIQNPKSKIQNPKSLMSTKQIFPGVHALLLSYVYVYLIEDGNHLTLIDTGNEHDEVKILDAVRGLGKQPSDITNIVVTHCHPDHAGGLAALKKHLSAPVWMTHDDAEVVRGNKPLIKAKPSPGLLSWLLCQIFVNRVPATIPHTSVENEVKDGDVLPISSGLHAIHTPGHSAGHTSFLLQRDGGLLFVADACANMMGLGYSIVYEDLAEGKRSLAKLARLTPHTICFGHGGPLSGNAVKKFQNKWR